MSLLYSSSFKYQEGDLMRKNPEFMDLNHHYYNQDQNNQNTGLTRYRSAPSSCYDSLINGNNGQNNGECEDYNILSRFLSECNGSKGNSNSQNMQMKQEIEEPAEIVYANDNGNSRNVRSSDFNVMNSMAMDINTMQPSKLSSVNNGSNLVKQHSSPAGFFNNLGVDNGFNITKDANGYRVSNGMNAESNPSSSRLGRNLNFSGRLLPQIAEIGDESPDTSSSESRGKRQYMNFGNDSSSNGFKRLRNNDGNVFTILENQNETGLTHHLSLPKTAGEMAHIEKYLEFQNSVPCKIRAKRGFATHPRSIAERVRRSRISQRIKKLQDLFPNMDKQSNTADMLDLAVEYIKDLQKQVETLTDKKAKCSCSSTHKLYASA